MTDEAYIALRAAVNLARNKQVRCLSTLKRLLTQHGFQQEHISEAIKIWANYERSKQC